MDIRYHAIRQDCTDGNCKVGGVCTSKNPAGILSKPLHPHPHLYHARALFPKHHPYYNEQYLTPQQLRAKLQKEQASDKAPDKAPAHKKRMPLIKNLMMTLGQSKTRLSNVQNSQSTTDVLSGNCPTGDTSPLTTTLPHRRLLQNQRNVSTIRRTLNRNRHHRTTTIEQLGHSCRRYQRRSTSTRP